MRVVLITRPHLEDVNRLLHKAARHRGLAITAVDSPAAAERTVVEKGPRLIYRAATDWNAKVFEKILARPGDALLHDPHFPCDEPVLRLGQAGLPMPRCIFVPAAEEDELSAQVDWLGGWPVVLKPRNAPWMDNLIRADDLDALVEHLEECGYDATLEAYVPHKRRWRLTVLGGRVLAASVRDVGGDDAGGEASANRNTAPGSPPEAANRIALNAAEVLRQDFGAASLLENAAGGMTLTRFDFPCAFAAQQNCCRVDIAGHLLEHLASKL